jgi:hypothetical protein
MTDRDQEIQMLATIIVLAALVKEHPQVATRSRAVAREMKRSVHAHLLVSDPRILDDVAIFIEKLEKFSNWTTTQSCGWALPARFHTACRRRPRSTFPGPPA